MVQSFIYSTLKNNIKWIILYSTIFLSLYQMNTLYSHDIEINNEINLNIYKKIFFNHFYYYLFLLFISISLFASIIYIHIEQNKNHLVNANSIKIPDRSYCERVSVSTFQNIGEKTTEEELSKLNNDPKFISMYEQKGENTENWNWQLRRDIDNTDNVSKDLSEDTISRRSYSYLG